MIIQRFRQGKRSSEKTIAKATHSSVRFFSSKFDGLSWVSQSTERKGEGVGSYWEEYAIGFSEKELRELYAHLQEHYRKY